MKYETPVLETERLILKRGTFEDYKAVYEFDFTKLRGINSEFKFVKQDPKKLIGYDTYAELNNEVFDWIIYLKDSCTPIANITADRVNKDINSIELAFNMHPNFWRKGYMYESVLKVMDYLYSFGFDNILSVYSEGNINSKNIAEKIGFESYSIKHDSWFKDGVSITDYTLIMSKEKFKRLYKHSKRI